MADNFPLLGSSSTTDLMTTTYQKLEIVKTLHSLDAVQSEQVLDFIKGLLQNRSTDPHHHQYLRRKAMKEIGQALRELGKA